MPLGQIELLERIPVQDIAHGVQLPEDILDKYCAETWVRWPDGESYNIGPGILWNMGSGADIEKYRRLKSKDFLVIDSDINAKAIKKETNSLAFSFVSSAESYGDRMGWVSLMFLEKVETVWMGGLLENMGRNWDKAIETAFISLKAGGKLLIGGVLRADIPNPKLEEMLGGNAYRGYQDRWAERYARAIRYNPRRYHFGSFPVARVGRLKPLEWGATSDLDRLVHSDQYERDAQHMDIQAIIARCAQLGMQVLVNRPEVWESRMPEQPLSGFTLLMQKPDRYAIDPAKCGMSYQEGGDWMYRKGLDALVHSFPDLKAYYTFFRQEFIRNCTRAGVTPSRGILDYLGVLIRGNGDDGDDLGAWPDPPDPLDM